MKIKINSKGKNINLIFPNRLFFNWFTAWIAANAINNNSDDFPNKNIRARDLRNFFDELNRVKKKHGNLKIVDIESANGDIVKITL